MVTTSAHVHYYISVWWTITITTLFKGIFMVAWFIRTTNNWNFFTEKKQIIDTKKTDPMNI